MEKYSFGTGRRKSAIVQARVSKGSGKIFDSNQKKVSTLVSDEIAEVLGAVSCQKKYDISLVLKGGGKKSQAEASKLAVARAISKLDDSFEKTMKKLGYLTRDPREKERKKPGLKGARRAPQWQKR
jgi:small subunit ribosomal protein S9